MARRRILPALALALGLAFPAWAAQETGTVYTLGNERAGNRLLAFHASPDGRLTPAGSVATGGRGSGIALGSQGALAISRDGRWLLAVNPGSASVSLFEITTAGPRLRQVVPSGGRNPISVALSGRSVAVLNAGGAVGASDTVTAFLLGLDGRLVSLKGATRPLSGKNVAPAQVAFALDGAVVVVTEKNTNRITTFIVGKDGLLSRPRVNPSAGPTPFGFMVTDDVQLVVSEAAGGAAGESSVSSYEIEADGSIVPVTSALRTGQTAACWTVTSRDGLGYLTNTGSGTVTALEIERDGTLSLLEGDGDSGSTGTGSAPIDLAFDDDQQYLYVLSHMTNTIATFSVTENGALVRRGLLPGLPPASAGLVTR